MIDLLIDLAAIYGAVIALQKVSKKQVVYSGLLSKIGKKVLTSLEQEPNVWHYHEPYYLIHKESDLKIWVSNGPSCVHLRDHKYGEVFNLVDKFAIYFKCRSLIRDIVLNEKKQALEKIIKQLDDHSAKEKGPPDSC